MIQHAIAVHRRAALLMVALLLSGCGSGRDSNGPVRAADAKDSRDDGAPPADPVAAQRLADLEKSRDNLRRIAEASCGRGMFAPAAMGAKVKHSWRVYILPSLGKEE